MRRFHALILDFSRNSIAGMEAGGAKLAGHICSRPASALFYSLNDASERRAHRDGLARSGWSFHEAEVRDV